MSDDFCVSIDCPDSSKHAEMDAYGKANGLTIVFAPWHPNPEYRIFKTGSLLSRNEEYPSGLVIVNERGVPQPWKSLPTSCCPVCRYEMDTATCCEKERAEPSAGDLSVCLNCGAMLQFNDILVLQPMGAGLMAKLPEDTRKLLVRASELIKQRGRIR